MVAPRKTPGTATFDDLAKLPGEARVEVIGGELVERAGPGGEHSGVQSPLGGFLYSRFNRSTGGRHPGGWWIRVEVTIELFGHEVYTPDASGWRRDRVAEPPRGYPVSVRPDWVCEILSPGNARQDRTTKLITYHRAGVPHYWIIAPEEETLTVHRWHENGYIVVLAAGRGDIVRAEPFDAIDLPVAILFGDDLPE